MWDFMPTVERSIQNDQMLVILFGAFQNLHEYDHWFDPINDLCKQIPNKVIVFNGKLTADVWRKTEPLFSYHRISMFDHISNIYYQDRPSMIIKPNKFYWASSKDWYPRRYILAGLVQNNLLSDGLVNYKCVHGNIPSDYLNARYPIESHAEIITECESISHLVPLPSIDDTVEFYQTDRSFYTDSYLGIITDTFFESGVFLSEKVFNAMNYKQLFFYIGSAHSLRYLKEQGYDTFDNIIDTSYDAIEDNAQRLFMARASLIKFLQQPIDKIRQDYVQCSVGIEKNKRLLMTKRPDLEITQHIQTLLNEY
jgi:hypothetical protein